MCRCIPWKASELSSVVLFEESDVFVLELDHLLGVVLQYLDGVFVYPE